MSEIDWARVSAVFAEALERPAAEREAFVAAACPGEPGVQAAVARLLAAEAAVEPGFLDGPGAELLGEVARGLAAAPERVGPWRLVRELGEGGMGQVFLAERADGEFEQQVAIKLLKRGMDSDAVLARFLRERQILAALDHPNIARLFDGGLAADGRPYFVMEHVDGLPVTRYADAHRLTVAGRLDLFRTICRAVEHAHRNLVIHRDLKPSNILVTADGHPKLLDFGIAKLLSSTGGEHAAPLTETGFRLMTPAYAAPEQFHGGAITTSTDVYGLGAVLYELLAGRRPFEVHGVPGAEDRRPDDAEPPTLSAAVTQTGAQAVAAARGTDPPRLRRQLAGDLETIVAAALRAAPERRYASVGALREDIRRHQEGMPVRARPDTAGYRLSRFVQRHRVAVAAAAAAAVLVAGFAVVAAFQAREAARERDRARQETAAAEQVADFLVGIFEVADPMRTGMGDTVRARDLLDRGAEQVASELAGQPMLQARMLGVIGRAYTNLSRADLAEPLLLRSIALQEEAGREPDVLASLEQLAVVRRHRGDPGGASDALHQALARLAGTTGGEAVRWSLLLTLVDVVHQAGDLDSARVLVQRALNLFDSLPPGAFPDRRAPLRRMASALGYLRDTPALERIFGALVEAEAAGAGTASEPVAAALTEWAQARLRAGNVAGADSLLQRAVTMLRQLGTRSADAAWTVSTLAHVAAEQGMVSRADSLFAEALAMYRERLGDDHRLVGVAQGTLARHLHRTGRPDRAIPHYRAAIATHRRSPDTESYLPLVEWRLAEALLDTGEGEAALATFAGALHSLEARYPPGFLMTAQVRRDYGRALLALGRPGAAAPQLRQALTDLTARWGATDPRVDSVRVMLERIGR